MNMIFSAQLYLGQQEKKVFSQNQIQEKITSAAESLDLKRLLLWDTHPGILTEEIIRFCHSNSIEVWLWHPVLADMNDIPVTAETMAEIPGFTSLEKLSGIWDKIGSGEENFLFVDPLDPGYHRQNFDIFLKTMDEYDFDGVFLDRIRYASPANGFESLFSTYLTSWLNNRTKAGRVHEEVRNLLSVFYSDLNNWDDDRLNSFNSLDEMLQPFGDFFRFKRENIENTVKTYKNAAHKMHKGIALDLLPSSLSFFTAQDYQMLSRHCDWIKDMTYCYAMGPAAFPLEIRCLIEGLLKLAPKVTERAAFKLFERHSGLEIPDTLSEIISRGINPENAAKELSSAEYLIEGKVPVFAGLEMVNTPYFSTRISEKMLEGYINALKGKTSGVVVSWNILHIPDRYFSLFR
ncbi:hypothetical protein [Spirochaeta isovalerica]|uniref:Glycosyl hydrolase-like 10 domain-containing protein n=1 Tax=Spirochaeta isovalerica TaxID=150 RepID=A0A841RC36_9SPIO|nr:hypothetical protein [Spirochaeta isovalerica]MBB6480449.1 hypothetical protein [Spirochaeta isovalerica]